jgi:CheY-like chemotaxis protein
MSILLIDDDPDILEAMAMWLRQSSYVVHPFDNVPDALQALYDGLRPSVIILDLFMPDAGGFDFRAAQLRDEQLAVIPVIVLSGYDTTDEEKSRLGVVRILSKPVDLDNLRAIIEAHGVPKTWTRG